MEEQPHGGINYKSHESIKESNLWWHGGAWSNSYKVDSFHPIINRFSTINLSNAGKVDDCIGIHGGALSPRLAMKFISDRGAANCEVHLQVKLPHSRMCYHLGRVLYWWGLKQGHEDREVTNQSSTFQASFINWRAHRRQQSPAELHDNKSTNSTATGQSLYVDTNNPAIAKSKDNSYTKPGVGKCYRRDEPEHKSNECQKRKTVNIADYEEEDDVLIETGEFWFPRGTRQSRDLCYSESAL